jgi:quercetin 2,3-dioxygenase
MHIAVYTQNEQGKGHFGSGEIVENKPIAFPHEHSAVKRVGPLFYWAWAKSLTTFEIPLHPHSGFEIISYVLTGTVGHRDTLGNLQQVSTGGAQVMQTGSGVYHAEELAAGTEMFQIWFEPHLARAVKEAPTYNQYDHEQFPVEEAGGAQVKRVVGPQAPIRLVTDAEMSDIVIAEGQSWTQPLPDGYALAAVVVSGRGTARPQRQADGDPLSYASLETGDFAVVTTDGTESVVFQAAPDESLRLVAIRVPAEVDYPLYRK